MDTSKEYIKMCEKAVEIRDFHTGFSRGDVIVNPFSQTKESTIVTEWIEKESITWLPRQDQLQEMVYKEQTAQGKLCYFHDWIGLVDKWHFKKDMSMEQLWLAFVMKEKYNKTWDGSEWRDR